MNKRITFMLALISLGYACTALALVQPLAEVPSKSLLGSILIDRIINDSQKSFHFRIISGGKISTDTVIAPNQIFSYGLNVAPSQFQLIGAFKNGPKYTLGMVGGELKLAENTKPLEGEIPLNTPLIVHIKDINDIRIVSTKEEAPALPKLKTVEKPSPALSESDKQKMAAERIATAINYVERLRNVMKLKGEVSPRSKILDQVAEQLIQASKQPTLQEKAQYLHKAVQLIADNLDLSKDKELQDLYGPIMAIRHLIREDLPIVEDKALGLKNLPLIVGAVRDLRDTLEKSSARGPQDVQRLNNLNRLHDELVLASHQLLPEKAAPILRRSRTIIVDNFGPQIPREVGRILFAIEKLLKKLEEKQ